MTSLFNDNENIACESCGKVIMREMSFCSVMTPLNNLSNKIEICMMIKINLGLNVLI